MTSQKVRGVKGLLDGILSSTAATATQSDTAAPIPTVPNSNDQRVHRAQISPASVRRGRPPRQRTTTCIKEKITIRVASSLIAEYREWTWEARCQLSQLVERAMAQYRERRSAPR